MKDLFCISTANVRGLRGRNMGAKIQSLILQFLDTKSDIACLVDTHLDAGCEHKITSLWDGQCYFSHGDPKTAGIAILTRQKTRSEFIPDPDGRYGLLRMTSSGRNFLICALYAPAKGPKPRSLFFSNLQNTIVSNLGQDEELILIGDFNCVEMPSLDRSSVDRHDPSVRDLVELTSRFGISDAFRSKFPDSKEFTFCSSQGHTSRLDRCYVPDALLNSVIQVEHLPNAFSDHSIVKADFDFSEVLRGHNSWNMPYSLLEDDSYISAVRRLWKGWQSRKSEYFSILQWWDDGKEEIKRFSLSFHARHRKREFKHERSVSKRLQNAINGGKTGLVKHFSAKLRELQNARARTHFTFRREKWVEEGERCTSYFLRQHSTRIGLDTVRCIKTPNGVSSDISDILEEFTSFYEELFTESEIDENAKSEVLNLLDLTLSDEQSNTCSSPFKPSDIKCAVTSMPNGKCPGLDGIPTEFYKSCWDFMSADLFEVFNASSSEGVLPESMRTAVIRCIPKKGDLTEVKNWRPISLLNTDYKIFARCIADRLERFLPFVISPSQTATVKSRKIQHNLNLLRDFIFKANSEQLEAFLLSIDQMKAFDRVNWVFLTDVLERQNFPPLIIRWVKILYTDITSCIRINGFTGVIFQIGRGVRQGCPLSPILYTIFSEALTRCIYSDPEIEGPDILGGLPVVSQYADDTTIGAIGDQSIFAIFRSLAIFERASGAKVNPDKSVGLWLGANRGRRDRPMNICWNSDFIQVLGVPLGRDQPPLDFWDNLLADVERRVTSWQTRTLSLKGKVIIIKQLLLPIFIYPSFILVSPKSVSKRLQAVFDTFFWAGKHPKIARHILELPVKLGGLSYPNVERMFSAIRLSWTRELFKSDTDGPWKILAETILSTYKSRLYARNIFKVNLDKGQVTRSNLPPFYKAWLKDWVDLDLVSNRPRPSSLANILCEPLFGSPFISASSGVPLKPPHWLSSNCTISKLADLSYAICPGWMPPGAVIEEHDLNTNPQEVAKILNRIPNDWRKIVASNTIDATSKLPEFLISPVGKKPTNICEIPVKGFYTMLKPPSVAKAEEEHASYRTPFYTSWESEIGPVSWPKVFTSLYKNHRDKKTTDIIFTLIHRGTVTRRHMKVMKMQEDSSCPRCATTSESIDHLFFTCPSSLSVWGFALRFLERLSPRSNFSFKRFVLVGWPDSDHPCEDIRLCLVATIWRCRNMALFEDEAINCFSDFRARLCSILFLRATKNTKSGNPANLNFASIAEFTQKRVYLKL